MTDPLFIEFKTAAKLQLVMRHGSGTMVLEIEPLSEEDRYDLSSLVQLVKSLPASPASGGSLEDLHVRVLSASNGIAIRSRRGHGNLVLAHPKTLARLRDEGNLIFKLETFLKIVPSYSVPENELWEFYQRRNDSMLDGPFAIVDDQFYLHPAWRKYCARILLS